MSGAQPMSEASALAAANALGMALPTSSSSHLISWLGSVGAGKRLSIQSELSSRPHHCAGVFMPVDCTSWSKFATRYYAMGVSCGSEAAADKVNLGVCFLQSSRSDELARLLKSAISGRPAIPR